MPTYRCPHREADKLSCNPIHIVVIGGGMVGMAIAARLQRWSSVTVVDDSFFPGLGETSKSLGVLRKSFQQELLASYAAQTWQFAMEQHEHPKSPVRLKQVPFNDQDQGAAYLDHLLLFDAYLFKFRRLGGVLKVRTEAVGLRSNAGGRYDVLTRKEGNEQLLSADAVVLAPGPRRETFSLGGLGQMSAHNFQWVMDVIVPFYIPSSVDHPHGITTIENYTIIRGLRPDRVLISTRLHDTWQQPSFEEVVTIIEGMQQNLGIPGEAQVDEVAICRDLVGPDGLPVVGPLDGQDPAPVFLAAGMGLNGLSIAEGVAADISLQLVSYFRLITP